MGDDAKILRLLDSRPNWEQAVTPREEHVIKMRYGIPTAWDPTSHRYTYKDIGARFSVSGATVRDIHRRALRKIRHMEISLAQPVVRSMDLYDNC